MIKDLLLQHGSGEFAEMLAVTSKQHNLYAQTFGLDFVVSHEALDCEDRYRSWEKQARLRRICKEYPYGTRFMLLDADAVILKMVDFREVAPLSEKNPVAVFGGKSWSNTGTLMGFVCPTFEKLLHETWNSCDNEKQGEDFYFHRALKKLNIQYTLLPETWNYFPFYGEAARPVTITEDQAIIRAWHGFTHKKAMRKLKQAVSFQAVGV